MSIFKIFSKKLTKTDVENRLSVTTKSLSSLPPFGEHQNYLDISLDDDEGHKWPFRLVVRRGQEEDDVTVEVKYKVKLQKPYIVFKAKLGYVSLYPAA
ncbi:hypothetical protein Pint_09623 [Pistacia integerrima]|uniref:Uncharacterized protein n=1 Tax=Pistacia integerrima TaxID=434235 RepID=A0ACC0XG12_9ROSI|nr:hypothetical protein Pint_09623 [Pistacia integerrima]